MVRSELETVLIYGGGFILLYAVLKSWGIITTSAPKGSALTGGWKPLTEQELNRLTTSNHPGDLYGDDDFYVRTGRDHNKYFGFVG